MRDDDTVIVLSDHGFDTFRRAVHINSWLRENGYLEEMVLLMFVFIVGCGDPMYGLKKHEKTQMREWVDSGVEIQEEKKPETATVLSFFVGLGSFYTDEPVLGVIDLLFWPALFYGNPGFRRPRQIKLTTRQQGIM